MAYDPHTGEYVPNMAYGSPQAYHYGAPMAVPSAYEQVPPMSAPKRKRKRAPIVMEGHCIIYNLTADEIEDDMATLGVQSWPR